MSGHSKWHNIKRQKGINDAQKSKLFSKVSRLITVSARLGGGDAESNPSLRLAIQKAKDARMPKENIDKAIKKGTGELEGSQFQEVVYEAFGPLGGAFMILCLTDNINRTVSELRSILGRFDGSLGTKGSAAYIFSLETKEPTFFIDIQKQSDIEKIDNLLEALEEMDDIQDIYHNYKFLE